MRCVANIRRVGLRGEPVVGYTEEAGCTNPQSKTETFVAIKAHIDNWRWSGVPFYLRTGKGLSEKVTQVVIAYKHHPHAIFPDRQDAGMNRLVIRLQPNEGIQLEMASKKQSLKDRLSLEKRILNLDFFDAAGEVRIPDAYERLLLEVFKDHQRAFYQQGWRTPLLMKSATKRLQLPGPGCQHTCPPKSRCRSRASNV